MIKKFMHCFVTNLVLSHVGLLQASEPIDPHLYQLRIDLPKETIYEMIGAQDGLGWSLAIADIIQSEPHFHRHTLETYTVVEGDLEVNLEGRFYLLHPGDSMLIPLLSVHSARSLTDQPARILVSCIPGWTAEDHLPANKEKP